SRERPRARSGSASWVVATQADAPPVALPFATVPVGRPGGPPSVRRAQATAGQPCPSSRDARHARTPDTQSPSPPTTAPDGSTLTRRDVPRLGVIGQPVVPVHRVRDVGQI